MKPLRVPTALRDKLGPDASEALVEMFHDSARPSVDVAIDRLAECFERRPAEGLARTRVELAQRLAALSVR